MQARLRRTAIWIALSRHMVSSARMELRRRRMNGNAPARTGSDFLSYLHKAVVDEGDRMTKKALAADAVQEGTSPSPVRPGHGAGTDSSSNERRQLLGQGQGGQRASAPCRMPP